MNTGLKENVIALLQSMLADFHGRHGLLQSIDHLRFATEQPSAMRESSHAVFFFRPVQVRVAGWW